MLNNHPQSIMKNRLLIFSFCLFILLQWTGCDTFGNQPETVTIPTDVQFDFSVKSADVTPNQAKVLKSLNTIDLTSILTAQNFSKASVKTVNIESAVLELVIPSNAPISSVKSAKLSLEASGATATQFATQTVFPQGANDDTVSLVVDATKEASAFVKATNFSGALELVTGTLQTGKDYEFQVRLKMILNVGF